MIAQWKFVSTTVIGTSHLRGNLPCQDYGVCKVLTPNKCAPILLSVVSDGAGSALYSQYGSEKVCNSFIEAVQYFLNSGGNIREITREFGLNWLRRTLKNLEEYAFENKVPIREFACTFLAAVIGEDYSVFFQLGDGAIIIALSEEPGEYGWVFWPQRGEYENTTFFITGEDAFNRLLYDFHEGIIQEVSLFTDGIQNLVLDYKKQIVEERFFLPLFDAFAKMDKKEFEEKISELLNSKFVNNRTDDDKTLVLATRRGVLSDVKR